MYTNSTHTLSCTQIQQTLCVCTQIQQTFYVRTKLNKHAVKQIMARVKNISPMKIKFTVPKLFGNILEYY
jgi:hypothetical protein